MKHTPGPWFIEHDASQFENHAAISAKTHGMLAHVVWKMEDDDQTPECEANARLIAAAPDLLAALREISADYADRFDLESPSTNPGIKIVIEQARAAIAKATGESRELD